jgi:hypothetical protein
MIQFSSRALLTVAAMLALAACARQHGRVDLVAHDDPAARADAGLDQPDAAVGTGRTASEADAALPSALHDASQPDVDGMPAPGVEVWIGTLHHAVVSTVSTTDKNPEQRDVDAVLLLHDDANGQLLSGTIAVGKASEAPTLSALQPGTTGTSAFWYAARYGLVEGFDYQMLSMQRSDTRLRFLVSASQLWQAWCCHTDGSYHCPMEVDVTAHAPGGNCTDLPPTQGFDLRIAGDMMEGTLAPAAAEFSAPVLRVRRKY